jgi:transcriptional regulator with XRE-family HTH domain
MTGLSTEAVSAVERGGRYPSLDTLERLAAALEFTAVIGPDRTEIFF